MKISFKIKEVRPRIFFFEFKNHYDLCMTLMRYQEHYESPNSKFRGKVFTILDFMDWYSKKDGKDNFNYVKDWAGFNFPANIIPWLNQRIKDPNDYDRAVYKAWHKCNKKYPDGNFYIIGAQKGNVKTLNHEIAHGFFFTDKSYKKEMTGLVKNLKPSLRKEIFTVLKELGYTPQVYVDECQAYLSTGYCKDYFKSLTIENKPFIKAFKTYYKK